MAEKHLEIKVKVDCPELEQLKKLVEELRGSLQPWYSLMDKLDIGVATGAGLDKIAELWGLKRNAAVDPMYGNRTVESDSDLRHRVKSYALDSGFINPNIVDPNSIDFSDIEVEIPKYGSPNDKVAGFKKCECGAASLGYTQPGPGHAHWCPIATK